jgi:hypothetical protein
MAAEKKRRRGTVRVAIIPAIVAMLPEIGVGIAAAADAEAGKPAGEVGANALNRLGALYGTAPATSAQVGVVKFNFDLGTNVIAKVAAGGIHLLARWTGLRIPLGRRATLL